MVRDKSTLERSKGGGLVGFIMDLPLHFVNLIYFIIFWIFYCGKWVFLFSLVIGTALYFLPDYRTRAVVFVNRTTGVNLSEIKVSDYIPALYGGQEGDEREEPVENYVSRETMVDQRMAHYDIPSQLRPFVAELVGLHNERQYFSKLSREKIGQRGEGAVPMLQKALKSPNAKLQKAAEKALSAIGTPEAMRALYQ